MAKEDNCEEAPLKVLEEDESKKGIGCLFAPLFWFRTLAKELHWSFVFGVISVYGISQGLGGALARVGTEYYMKDVQKVQPSEAQVYAGITSIPWIVKPLWGLLTDVLPVFGYRRRPYLMLSGLLGMCSMLVLSMHENLHLALALLSLTAGSAGVAIADVTIDACVAHNSINHPSLAADMQSLCSFSSSIGALIGFSISGIFVHLIGPMGVFGLMTLPAALVFSVGILLNEPHIPDFAYKQVSKKFCDVSMAMWKTLKCPDVWRPCLYMYLSFALSFNIFDGMFYWYTDSKDGPKFSKEAIGYIFSVGSAGALIGTILYQIALKDHPFRNLLFWTQLLLGLSGMLDLVLVFRLNLRFGIPDYFFVVIDECVSQMIYRLKWMPLLVLSTKLCPPGIEGTFFALLMSIDNAGLLSSSWGGGFLLHVLNVTRTQFDNLWIAILIRNILRVAPLLIIFLVPSSDPKSSVLPTESTEDSKETETTECRNIELVSLVKSADSDNVRHNSSV